jgi:hypothetical protein
MTQSHTGPTLQKTTLAVNRRRQTLPEGTPVMRLLEGAELELKRLASVSFDFTSWNLCHPFRKSSDFFGEHSEESHHAKHT